MKHLSRVFVPLWFVWLAGTAQADPKSDVEQLLSRPILAPEQTLAEVQNFAASSIPPLPQPASLADWEMTAKHIREQTLINTVYRGEAAKWRETPLKVEWQETIAGGIR